MDPLVLFLFFQISTIAFLAIYLYVIDIYYKDSNVVIITKRFIRKYYNTLFGYVLIFMIIFGFATVVSYIFFTSIDPEKPPFDRWEKTLQVAIATAGFLSIIITIKLYQDNDKRQVSKSSIELFEKFRDERFSKIRDISWEVRKKWREEAYKEKIIKVSFVKTDDLIIAPEELNEEEKKLKQEMTAVRDLFEFYSNLAIYKDVPQALIACRFFYYGWWRPFLYEIAHLHDNKYVLNQELLVLEEKGFFDYNQYKDNLSYVNKLKDLDKIFGFESVPENMVFHSF